MLKRSNLPFVAQNLAILALAFFSSSPEGHLVPRDRFSGDLGEVYWKRRKLPRLMQQTHRIQAIDLVLR